MPIRKGGGGSYKEKGVKALQVDRQGVGWTGGQGGNLGERGRGQCRR